MSQGAYISVWETIIPGREQQSLEVFQSLKAYWDGLKEEGRITSRRAYLSTTPGDNGFEVVEGDFHTLAGLLGEDAHRDICLLARTVLQGLRAHLCIDVRAGDADLTTEAAEADHAYFQPWARVHPEVSV
jgi:hypothetical protein